VLPETAVTVNSIGVKTAVFEIGPDASPLVGTVAAQPPIAESGFTATETVDVPALAVIVPVQVPFVLVYSSVVMTKIVTPFK